MNKHDFIRRLQQSLGQLEPAVVADILADFEEHFIAARASGKSEAEIAAELGDPGEIARQYIEAAAEGRTHGTPAAMATAVTSAGPAGQAAHRQPVWPDAGTAPGPSVRPGSQTSPAAAQAGRKADQNALLAVILLNLFIGIPVWFALFSALTGLWVAAGSIGVAAISLFVVAIFQAGMLSLILVLFGLSLTALTILAVILMVFLTKWTIRGLTAYINWNRKLIYGGAPA